MPRKTKFNVLLYHGVYGDDLTVKSRNSSGKHVHVSRFDKEMKWLSQNRPLISMMEIENALIAGSSLPDEAVAVTFDDGFLNNYTTAWPVLDNYQIPTTFYLATGFIGTNKMIWSDCLEDAILETTKSSIELKIREKKLNWGWDSENGKIDAFRQIKAICKSIPEVLREKVMKEVCAKLDYLPKPSCSLYRFMDWDQVREMNKSDRIDIGAHTIDHVALSRVEPTEMHRQIDLSLSKVSKELDQECVHFSYPEGQEKDFSSTVISYLRKQGIKSCPTAIDGTNVLGETDPFRIYRNMVGFEGRKFPFEY